MFQKLPIVTTALRSLICFLGILALPMPTSRALELSDLHLPMTRDEADTALSKDFESAVLEDGCIRRTWKLPNKTVFVDFNSETQEAILIAVVYDQAVPRKQGVEDAHALVADKLDKNIKWAPPKNAEASRMVRETFGLENALRKKFKDKSRLFIETDAKKKHVVRISLFAHTPSTNRWVLKSIEPGADKTAMGTRWSQEHLSALYEDEERRRSSSDSSPTPSPAQLTSTDSSPSSTQSGSPTVVRTALGSAPGGRHSQRSSASAPSQTSGSPATTPHREEKVRTVVLKQAEHASEKTSFMADPPDWLEEVGIEEPEWWHYIALGIAALIILIMVIRHAFSLAAAVRRRKNFEKIVGHAPPHGRVKLHK